MAESHVLQADSRRNLGGHTHLLTDAVHQMEFHFREQNGERDTRETSSCTQVHDRCTRCELGILGDAQRMEHMVFVQVGDVLAGNHVNLRVPIQIEVVQGRKLAVLFLGQIREIFGYNVHILTYYSNNVRFPHTALPI